MNAPRASVYRALLDARAVATWKVPTGMTSHVHEFEPPRRGLLPDLSPYRRFEAGNELPVQAEGGQAIADALLRLGLPARTSFSLILVGVGLLAVSRMITLSINVPIDVAIRRAFALAHKERTHMKPKNTICLWFDKDALDAARFYAATFPNSQVTAVHKAPADYPSGKAGDVLTVEFTVFGIPCLGLNGGPEFRHSEAFSFQIATDDQAETDRYWNAIVNNGGQESQCGWCKDRWGLSWQITPRALTDALAAGGAEAKRAFEAMMPMRKIDVATIEAARRG